MNSGRINFRDRKPIDKTPADDSDENLIDTSYEKNKEAFDELNDKDTVGEYYLLGVLVMVLVIFGFLWGCYSLFEMVSK